MSKKVISGKKMGRVISGRENGEKSGEARRTFGQQCGSDSKQGARGGKKVGRKCLTQQSSSKESQDKASGSSLSSLLRTVSPKSVPACLFLPHLVSGWEQRGKHGMGMKTVTDFRG